MKAAHLDVVQDSRGDVGVEVDQSFFLQQLWQRAAPHIKTKAEIHTFYQFNPSTFICTVLNHIQKASSCNQKPSSH